METKEEYPFNVLFTSVNKMIVADPPALLKESYQAYKAEIRKKKEIQWQKNPPPPGLTEVQLWAWPHLPLPIDRKSVV